MPHGTIVEVIPAGRAEVFRLFHDYSRRPDWDTLLQAAYLSDGFTTAGLRATSVCKGKWFSGGLAIKTEYVSFRPPDVAAVKMVNRPALLDAFAAAIHHRERSDGSSDLEYKYSFTARPAWLRWLLHPVMDCIFRIETKRRLRGLRAYFGTASLDETMASHAVKRI
jgi:hypothetical protein